MSIPVIFAFLFDDENLDKFWARGFTDIQIASVLENRPYVGRNRKNRRGSHIVIGVDDSGNYISIPVEPTYDEYLWRPITAWQSKKSERTARERALRSK